MPFHDLRHTLASYLVDDLGLGVAQISRISATRASRSQLIPGQRRAEPFRTGSLG
jgi:hypothetical protein